MRAEAFGKYEVARRIAVGGMAEICLATLRLAAGVEKRVVLKRILAQYSHDSDFVRMFEDEARVAVRLSHSNVVQVFDFGKVGDTHYMAMELVDGADLREIMKALRREGMLLAPAEVAAIGEGVARGLAYVHAATSPEGQPLGIVHRDVSPHNIMLTRAGEAKVMDFGIAKAAARATQTKTGTIKGKLAYMAPEQAAGHEVDGRCDQFALGVVLWECLAGCRLFEAASEPELLRKVLECEVRPLEALRPDVPPELTRIVHRMLSRDPADRYARLDDVAAALQTFRFGLGEKGVVDLAALVQRSGAPSDPPARGTLPMPGRAMSDPRRFTLATTDSGDTASTETARGAEAVATVLVPQLPHESDGNRAPSKRRGYLYALAGAVVAVAAAGAWAWLVFPGTEAQALTATAAASDAATGLSVLAVSSSPAGATIYLDGADTGLVTPAEIGGQRRGARVLVSLRLAGYEPWAREVILDSPFVQVAATVWLRPPGNAGGVRNSAPPAAAPRLESRRAQPGRRATPGVGYLSVASTGAWYDVYLGEKKLGTTTLERVELPAGRHSLRLQNPAVPADMHLDVVITAGKETRRTVH